MQIKWEGYILAAEKVIVLVLLLFLVLSGFYKFFARNFLSSGPAIEISDQISTVVPHCIVLLGMVGASIGISRSEVIQIDLLRRLFPEKYRKVIQKTVYGLTALTLVAFLGVAYYSLEFGDKLWILLGYMPAFFLLWLKSLFKVFA